MDLLEIASNGEYTAESAYVNSLIDSYRESYLAMNKDEEAVFNVTGQDLINIARSEDVDNLIDSLNKINRFLICQPLNIEEKRKLYDIVTTEFMVKA
jgi:hypothetical protein